MCPSVQLMPEKFQQQKFVSCLNHPRTCQPDLVIRVEMLTPSALTFWKCKCSWLIVYTVCTQRFVSCAMSRQVLRWLSRIKRSTLGTTMAGILTYGHLWNVYTIHMSSVAECCNNILCYYVDSQKFYVFVHKKLHLLVCSMHINTVICQLCNGLWIGQRQVCHM